MKYLYKLQLMLCLLSLALVVFLSENINILSQIKQETTADSLKEINIIKWYDPTYDQLQIKYTKPTFLPPFSSDMDYETLITYKYIDSLMRINKNTLKTQLNNWFSKNPINDTAKFFVKMDYKLVDFDPQRFNQYIDNQDLKYYQTSLSTIHSMSFSWFYNVSMKKNLMENYEYIKFMTMIYSDYVLRVKVVSIDSTRRVDKRGINDRTNTYTYIANAIVLDTLKGKRFKQGFPININTNNVNQMDLNNYSTIQFNFLNDHRYNPKVTKEYVVFLKHTDNLIDRYYDYYYLSVYRIFEIENNVLKNELKIWSDSTSINYQDWKLDFYNKRNQLINGDYFND